jgi:hypothetical protein
MFRASLPYRQEVGLRFTAYGFLSCCSVTLESRVARCAHCDEDVAWRNILLTVHTSCYPTLQHHNNYNRTENHRQWNAVRPLDDGRKDARNMLRKSWLPINHYLLHLVGLTFIYFLLNFSFNKLNLKWVELTVLCVFSTMSVCVAQLQVSEEVTSLMLFGR